MTQGVTPKIFSEYKEDDSKFTVERVDVELLKMHGLSPIMRESDSNGGTFQTQIKDQHSSNAS